MTRLSKCLDKKLHRPTLSHHHNHHHRVKVVKIHDLIDIVDGKSLHYNGIPRSMDESGRQPKQDSSFPTDVSVKPSSNSKSQPQTPLTTTDSNTCNSTTTSVTFTLPSNTNSQTMFAPFPGAMPGSMSASSSLRASSERQLQQSNQTQTTSSLDDFPAPLQDLRAEVENCEEEGYTYLMLASRAGKMDVVKVCIVLAQSGQTVHHPNHRGRDGNNALMLAVENGHTEIACILVDVGTDLNLVNGKLETALTIACKRGDRRVAELILAKGGATSCGLPDKTGTTPLIHASRLGDAALVEALLASGTANLEAEDNDGHTALISACQHGHVSTVKALLVGGANVNQRTKDLSTALIFGAHHGSPEITRLLLEAGADVNACNEGGLNSVIQACRHGKADTLRLLIEAKADLNQSLTQGQTALKYALVRSVVSLSPCLNQLLDAGVHIGGEMQYAVSLGFFPVVEQFLKHGAEPRDVPTQHVFQAANSRGIHHVSPLAVALIFQHHKLIHLFLDSGFLTRSDMTTLPNDATLRAYLAERGKLASLEIVQERMRPWSLHMLCLHAASKLVGYETGLRKNRVKTSGLPPAFQRQLSYECVYKE